ncbi:hypothetical protein Q3G72_005973 [Acer saccharum]|nr:hypothetical protein Q3G72_005973 [Acer saccharum]
MDVKNPPMSYPGTIDPSVLYEQDQHISSAIWEGQDRGTLMCHEHTSKINGWKLLKKQIDLVGKRFVKLSWLKENLSECTKDALDEEMEQRTRAFLLYLVGSTIFATTSCNLVPLSYLPLFKDFDKAGKYAWGAAALAFLYRQLGKASMKCQYHQWLFDVTTAAYRRILGVILFLGRSRMILICMDEAEWHLPDCCLRQFGLQQRIPKDVQLRESRSNELDFEVAEMIKIQELAYEASTEDMNSKNQVAFDKIKATVDKFLENRIKCFKALEKFKAETEEN